MNRRLMTVAIAATALGLVPSGGVLAGSTPPSASPFLSQAVCPLRAPVGHVTCLARALTQNGVRVRPRFALAGQPALATSPTGGYTPADIASAYNLLSTSTSTVTIGIVDAYDDPSAEADLGVYRSQFGLPPCTTANGCFRKVSQTGSTTYPSPDVNGSPPYGWEAETSLDLDAASAACPSCHLLLVEATDSVTSHLMTATRQAKASGATVVSLSFGGPESSSQVSLYDPSLNLAGVTIFAAAGDSGYNSTAPYGADYPATSSTVVAVGGTTLARNAALLRGWSESVWGPGTATTPQGTGSGCSLYEPKPAWQTDAGCGRHRTSTDVAADADPNTGLAVYDSYGSSGWNIFGGTSLAAPLVAGITARAGGAAGATGAQLFYGQAPLNDVTAGTDSLSGCSPPYLCTAQPGYDGPSGNGTPNGLPIPPAAPSPAPVSSPATRGYWLLASDGGIFPFGSAGGYGSTGGIRLNQPIVGMAATPSRRGYWLVAGDGGIFPFGDAVGYGSTGGIRLNQHIVGMAATPDGGGYWLVARDGGIFPFGNAVGYGSTGGIRLNQPINGMAVTPDGQGYWLVASDGGIFPFGNAGGFGSTGGIRLNHPMVGMAGTADGRGYWLVASDGGIFPFGDAAGYGSTGGLRLNQPIEGMSTTPDQRGYWLVASDGGIFPFGDAGGYGSLGGIRLNQPIVGMAAS